MISPKAGADKSFGSIKLVADNGGVDTLRAESPSILGSVSTALREISCCDHAIGISGIT